jgi:LAS superfamily LD-carboxypeptidase LdcB
MTIEEYSSFCKHAQMDTRELTRSLAVKYNALVQNNTKQIGQRVGFQNTNRMTSPSNFLPKGIGSFNIGGKTIQVQKDFGQRLVRANAEYFKNTGKHFNITSGYRSAADQQKIINQMGGRPIPGRVAPVGKSLHNFGAAVDIANWQEAAPYLQRQGVINPIAGDRVHFRSGQFKTESELRKYYGGS